MESEGNAFMWQRGDARERGLHPLNYQSLGMDPWIQQQVMPAAALQDLSGGDFLKQQLLQYQQPFQFPQQSVITSPLLQQQFIQQTDPQQIICSRTYGASQTHSALNQQLQQPHNEQPKHVQEMQNFPPIFSFQNNYLQQQKSSVPSQLCQNLVFSDPVTNFSSVLTPDCIQNISRGGQRDGSANVLNLPKVGQTMTEQNQQRWEPKLTMSQVTPFGSTVLLHPFPEKDGSAEADNCTADSQNDFGLDSSSLLSNGVPNLSANAFDTNVAAAPYTASCIQNALYDYLDQSSGLGQHGEETDPRTETFVKVYKSGSVGRSLDISRFSSYEELREELGQMFGVEGLLEDPRRSGWQLVFVDRENDVLLLGDDPWEAFVNNVWYIKILSPEDVQKMGKPGVDSFS